MYALAVDYMGQPQYYQTSADQFLMLLSDLTTKDILAVTRIYGMKLNQTSESGSRVIFHKDEIVERNIGPHVDRVEQWLEQIVDLCPNDIEIKLFLDYSFDLRVNYPLANTTATTWLKIQDSSDVRFYQRDGLVVVDWYLSIPTIIARAQQIGIDNPQAAVTAEVVSNICQIMEVGFGDITEEQNIKPHYLALVRLQSLLLSTVGADSVVPKFMPIKTASIVSEAIVPETLIDAMEPGPNPE